MNKNPAALSFGFRLSASLKTQVIIEIKISLNYLYLFVEIFSQQT